MGFEVPIHDLGEVNETSSASSVGIAGEAFHVASANCGEPRALISVYPQVDIAFHGSPTSSSPL
jgi:hypothetical protein